MWLLAVKTLLADRGKLYTALIGVVFSVVLVNVQGGLFVGLIRKASLLVDQGGADVWVGHKLMNNVDFPHDIPRSWGHRIQTVRGVIQSEPYVIGHSVMTLPNGGFEQVLVVGCDPSTLLGGADQVQDVEGRAMRYADGVLVDVYDAQKLGNPQIGDLREIGRRRARVVGFTEGTLGFLVTPYVFTTLDRAAQYLHKPASSVSYFLVKVADGEDSSVVCNRIKQRLPDAEAFTRSEYARTSIGYWLKRTGLGISFGASTFLGLFVGLVIVGQTLYASVLDRLTEFGALKAIGAHESQIYRVILHQALLLATVGSAVGLLVVLLVQHIGSTPRASIAITWSMALGSCLLVTVICIAASLTPYLRIRRIDAAAILHA